MSIADLALVAASALYGGGPDPIKYSSYDCAVLKGPTALVQRFAFAPALGRVSRVSFLEQPNSRGFDRYEAGCGGNPSGAMAFCRFTHQTFVRSTTQQGRPIESSSVYETMRVSFSADTSRIEVSYPENGRVGGNYKLRCNGRN